MTTPTTNLRPPSIGPPGRSSAVYKTPPIDLGSRLALRPREAAVALGVSERTLRGLLPELPHVRVGGCVLLPVAALREWLSKRVQADADRAEGLAREVVAALGRDSR